MPLAFAGAVRRTTRVTTGSTVAKPRWRLRRTGWIKDHQRSTLNLVGWGRPVKLLSFVLVEKIHLISKNHKNSLEDLQDSPSFFCWFLFQSRFGETALPTLRVEARAFASWLGRWRKQGWDPSWCFFCCARVWSPNIPKQKTFKHGNSDELCIFGLDPFLLAH